MGASAEAGFVPSDDAIAKSCVIETLWRRGVALVGGRKLEVERLKGLDEFSYRFKGDVLDPASIEGFNPTEYIDWRDG